MQLNGFLDAYFAFEDETYLLIALKNAKWIKKFQLNDDYTLFRNHVEGRSTINGFLDDYAHTIAAFIKLYQASFDEEWLILAKNICDKCIELFQDKNSKMFYFTDSNSTLIARKMEITDNVIPSSNSVMCLNLFLLGRYFVDENYSEYSIQLLSNVYDKMEFYGAGYSNWAIVLMNNIANFKEIGIVGNNFSKNKKIIQKEYFPNALFYGGNKGKINLLNDKDLTEDSFYVCENNSCSPSEKQIELFVKQISSTNFK